VANKEKYFIENSSGSVGTAELPKLERQYRGGSHHNGWAYNYGQQNSLISAISTPPTVRATDVRLNNYEDHCNF